MTPAARMIIDLRNAGATHSHIARMIGVSRSAVCRWEHSQREPSEYAQRRLSRIHARLVGGVA